MSMLKRAKINKVSMDLSNYYYLIQGVQKSGKTTFARDFILEMCDGDAEKGLLLAIGKEKGYKALDDINALDIETWKDFDAVIKELVEEKEEHGIKYIFVDTYDELIPLAEKEIMRMSVKATGKPCKTFNSAFGGYGQPRIELRKLVTEKLELLNKHFGLFILGHTKLKTIKEQGMVEDQEYQKLSSNLNADYHNIVAHKADVIGTVVIEKEVNDKRLSETKTMIYFRDNGFVEAGARFKNIAEKTEFNAKNFISTIKDAIKNSSKTSVTDEQMEEIAKQEKLQREQELLQAKKEEEEQQEATVCDTEKNKELFEKIKPLYTSADKTTKLNIKDILKGYGQTKFDLNAPCKMFEEVLEVLLAE